MKLICVDPLQIGEFWKFARERIRTAVEYTDLSDFYDVETDVLLGKQLLWLAWDGKTIAAAATTHLGKVGRKTICTLTACSGHHMETWLPLFAEIEDYARKEGAEKMRIFGRKGWAKVLDGYKAEYVIMEKALA